MALPVTAAMAAALAALLLLLAIDTVRNRIRAKTPFGTGDDEKLTRASRAHANLAEHAPLAVILVGLLEYSNANHMGLMVLAGVFLLARLLHAIGLYMDPPGEGKPPLPRFLGVVLTWLVLAALIGWTLWMLTGNL
ncbi:MAG: MAPEG family protein [Sphingomonadaceae bacterium]|nr:MAPEG family protein [Sphingomonadaceae bacterium]